MKPQLLILSIRMNIKFRLYQTDMGKGASEGEACKYFWNVPTSYKFKK